MKKMITAGICVLVIGLSVSAVAQECGPACPACSGKTTGDLLPEKTVMGTVLYIPEGEEETAVYNLRFGLFSWLDAGVGYSKDEEETLWSVRVQPVAQDLEGWRPGLIVGTGSIQTGGSDQSIYAQLVKTWDVVEDKLGLSLAGGYATDSDFEEEWGLGTVSVTLFDLVSPFYSYDGISSHAGASVFATDWLTLTGYALEMEDFAVTVGLQWGFGSDS